MNEFEIQITDVPDRDDLVAEIWFNDDLICEIINESGRLEIELFSGAVNKFDYSKFLEVLDKSKSKLLGLKR